MNDEMIVVAKVGGAALLGSVLALRFIPGTWWQRGTAFTCSLALGCLGGGFAKEWFALIPGSYMHMCAVATAAIFGLAIVTNGMQQIPEILEAIRRRVVGS